MSWLSNFATEQDEINQLQQQPGALPAPGLLTGAGKAIVNGVETAAVSMMGLTESFVLDAVEGLGELAEDDDVAGQAQARRRDLEQGLPQAVRRLQHAGLHAQHVLERRVALHRGAAREPGLMPGPLTMKGTRQVCW